MDLVIHAGARVATSGNWEEFEATNVQATEKIIQLATAAGVRRVVHVSSLSVYAVPADGVTVTEDSSYESGAAERGFYSRSKLAADQLACRAMAAGAPLTVVRPGLLFGPGQRPPLARRAIALGPVRLILARRGYLLPLAYVENVADALWLAARSERAAGRAYTIVDQNIPQAEYTVQYRHIAGQSWTPVYLPPAAVLAAVGLVERAAKVFGRRAPVSRHQVARATYSARFDTRRALEELGWQPRVALADALRLSFAGGAASNSASASAPARSAA
jgi:nucleoside-diphosphate-sugar epimerase